MRIVHEFMRRSPFDVYGLHLFHLVARHTSFTKAAEIAGLTQSAVTRQVQSIEQSLGVELFERTTRSVRLTPAGAALREESTRLVGDVDRTLKRIREEFAGAKKEIRVGVSRSIGLAYLPGFFHANLKRRPRVSLHVSYQSSSEILTAIDRNEIDVGVICPPERLPSTVKVTHRFADAFVLIGSVETEPVAKIGEWAAAQDWILISESSTTGRRLRDWIRKRGLKIEPALQLDSFDLIINLVALGMGVSWVPIRALALYNRKQKLRRLKEDVRFVRELVVVVRRNRKMPRHLEEFVGDVLF
jgi:DNA-binding transcriptional LysR family regulator